MRFVILDKHICRKYITDFSFGGVFLREIVVLAKRPLFTAVLFRSFVIICGATLYSDET